MAKSAQDHVDDIASVIAAHTTNQFRYCSACRTTVADAAYHVAHFLYVRGARVTAQSPRQLKRNPNTHHLKEPPYSPVNRVPSGGYREETPNAEA